jgi:hypothetical protein
MKSIACSYCKGPHHIRYCSILKEKNNRSSKFSAATVAEVRVVERKVAPQIVQNTFIDLYSSSDDDEIEEGEIVEENRKARREPVVEEKWTRSGIFVANAAPLTEPNKIDEEEDLDPMRPLVNFDPESFTYYNKYKGMSWVDIEYEDDDE